MQFLETMETLRIHGDIKIVTTERRRHYLVSEEIFILKKRIYL